MKVLFSTVYRKDFRPQYGELGQLRSMLSCPVLFLSATMYPQMRSAIFASMYLNEKSVVTIATNPDRYGYKNKAYVVFSIKIKEGL